MSLPVTKLAFSEARNDTTFAISSGFARWGKAVKESSCDAKFWAWVKLSDRQSNIKYKIPTLWSSWACGTPTVVAKLAPTNSNDHRSKSARKPMNLHMSVPSTAPGAYAFTVILLGPHSFAMVQRQNDDQCNKWGVEIWPTSYLCQAFDPKLWVGVWADERVT